MVLVYVFTTYTYLLYVFYFFFFTVPATTEIYTLSLHDALPIYIGPRLGLAWDVNHGRAVVRAGYGIYYNPMNLVVSQDRKSTRLNSSHTVISYAVFCLKKKKKKK